MEIEKVDKSNKEIVIKLKDMDEGLLIAFRERLLEDEKVSFTNYYRRHPILDEPELVVRIASGKPQAALKRASKSLANDYGNLKKLLSKACAKYEAGD